MLFLLSIFLGTSLSISNASADANTHELLSKLQKLNQQNRNCEVPSKTDDDFCTSISNSICKNTEKYERDTQKAHDKINPLVIQSLLDRNASGNLEYLGRKIPANEVKSASDASFEAILQNKEHEDHFRLNYNYTLAANDLLWKNRDTHQQLFALLAKVKESIRRLLQKNKQFENCKSDALAKLNQVTFGDIRLSPPEKLEMGCGTGDTHLLSENAFPQGNNLVLCPGILKSGFFNQDYDYLIAILAHEIGHILENTLTACYPTDCISNLPGGGSLEKQAEWFAVKSLPFLENEKGQPSKSSLKKVITQYGQFMCRLPNATPGTDSHPSKEDRLNVYFGQDTRLREILNCSKVKAIEGC